MWYCILGICLAMGILWAALIRPNTRRSAQLQPFCKWCYAHRGLHSLEAGIPENSLAAFAAAAEQGFGIELDLHLSEDGEVVVFHDERLERMCGLPGRIWEYTAERLQQTPLGQTEHTIPKFCEALQQIAGRVPLIIELKLERNHTPLCAKAAALLDGYAGAYCIQSFDPRCVRWFRKHRPQVLRGQLAERFRRHGTHMSCVLDFALRNLLLNCWAKPDFIAYNVLDAKWAPSLGLCNLLYRPGKALWVIRNAEQQAFCSARGSISIFEGFLPRQTK